MMFKSKLKTRIAIWIILAVIVLNGVLPSFYNDVYATWTVEDNIIMPALKEQSKESIGGILKEEFPDNYLIRIDISADNFKSPGGRLSLGPVGSRIYLCGQ